VLDPEVLQRVNDGICDHGQPRRDAALTPAPHAKRVGSRRHFTDLGLKKRQAVGPRQRVKLHSVAVNLGLVTGFNGLSGQRGIRHYRDAISRYESMALRGFFPFACWRAPQREIPAWRYHCCPYVALKLISGARLQNNVHDISMMMNLDQTVEDRLLHRLNYDRGESQPNGRRIRGGPSSAGVRPRAYHVCSSVCSECSDFPLYARAGLDFIGDGWGKESYG
jgi:hypothetical protein